MICLMWIVGLSFFFFFFFKQKTAYEIRLSLMGSEMCIRDRLELVGLKDKMKNRPSELSGGEQQRVSLARALVNNPEIIIADEPTGNVDPEMSHEIIELLNEINATGTTVIVVTHEHDLVREFDRRVVVLDHGKIKSDTKDLFVKDDYADDYGDDSGEEENTPDYPR